MPARLFLSSGDLIADRRYEFARDLQLKGDLVAAADLLDQAVELAPAFTSAWFTLGEIRQQLGERDAAITAFRKAREADASDPHGAGLRLMRLGAEQLSSMPPAYVRTLFDQYAPRFDRALIDAAQLEPAARDWLNAYHARVREALSPLLAAQPAVQDWLRRATAPI